MRILIVDTCYAGFLQSHYAARSGLEHRSYDEQWRALMDRFFGTADSYSHFLKQLGHEAHELVLNCEPLQRAWEVEHGEPRTRWLRPYRRSALVVAQAEAFQPDVVYVQDLNVLDPKLLRELRGRARLLVGQIASRAPGRAKLAPFDLVLTSFPHYVTKFQDAGIASEYFRIGFDPRVLDHVGAEARTGDVAFVGGLARGPHAKGNDLLGRVAQRAPVDFWGYKPNRWPADSPLRRRYRGEAWGLDMYRVLARSRIALNRHIDDAEDNANNMRLYEATGVGALLLTDAKRNLPELFEPGEEVVTYASEDELVEKIAFYLRDETERARIARAGQERTLREHTYARRMQELIGILDRYLS